MSVTLHTARLTLRPIVSSDAEAFFALNRDPEVARYTGEPPPATVEEVRKRIDAYPDYRDYGFGRLACVLHGTDEMIGFCGLKKLPELDGEIDIGYRLAPAHWGRGLATEAARAVLDFGFGELSLERIIAIVHPDNARSVRVIEKLEMVYEAQVEYFGERVDLYARHAPSVVE